MKHVLAVAFAVGALAAAVLFPAPSFAFDTLYDANCAQCHGPTRTCSGCHAHGTHNLANKQDFGLTATSDKASYAAGEDVVVSVGGGYRCGWVRMQLLDATMKELAKSSGAGGLGNGPDSCNGTIPTPIVLRAPAPTTPGTYTWYAAWYGNKFDLTERGVTTTVFGPNFKDGPGASHGRELIPVRFTVLAGGTPVAAIPAPSLVFPTVPVGATASISTAVQNSGNAVLQVNSISRCDANALPFSWKAKTPFSIGPGASFSLPVTYQPTSAVTSTTCLKLATNDPANATMTVSLSGAATPAPAGTPGVSTSVFGISFGTSVLAGTFATQTFQVQSVGTANLSVTSIDPCPGSTMFAGRSDDLPGVIAPGESRTVTVTYTPTAAGTNNGCVTISTNGGVATVNASGGAIMPAVTCTSCHGGKDNQTGAPPTDTAGETATTRIGVGSHSAHLNTQISPIVAQQAADCTACHESVVAFTDPKHRDGSTDVPFGGVSKMGGAAGAWNPATPTCGTVYCHGGTLANADGTNTAPTWTNVGAGEAACGRCHGVPPTSNGHPTVTGGLTACVSCHPETMTAAGTLDPAGTHIDGIVQAAGCTSCHGSAANPAPPKDTLGNTATTFAGVGAHQSHVTASNISPAFGCSDCHGAQVASYTSGHKNGVVDMGFSALAGTSSAFNTTTLSCASTYCHGNFKNG
ncbi:MAG: choice-of-anchor D domain-containing protein, partial [Anaeromyxobacteraceae bacterium]